MSPEAEKPAAQDEGRVSNKLAMWIAVLGVIATLGAAYIGGYYAKTSSISGAKEAFRQQHNAEITNLRRDAYVDFLGVIDTAAAADQPDEIRVTHALTVVDVLATSPVRDQAHELRELALDDHSASDYNAAREAFVREVQDETKALPGAP
jgi:hypothetical protein